MNRFAAFSLGVVFTTVSVGAVNYVAAAGDPTIKACANKQTGTLRYVSKGQCKKTETTLTWNKIGPQGPQGLTAAGATQQIHLVDSTGRDFGIPLSVTDSSNATIFYDSGVWKVSSSPTLNIWGDGSLNNDSQMFWDSSCTQPFFRTPAGANSTPNARTFHQSLDGTRRYFKPTGSPFSGSSLSTWYTTVSYGSPNGCKLSSVIDGYNSSYTTDAKSPSKFYTNVIEINPPPYMAPFTLVLK